MARPSSFRKEFVQQAEKLCKLGATDVDVADFFGVDVRTIHRWKGEFQEFCHALKVGKEVADERVERSLYARANGYEHDEVDIRVVSGEIVKTDIRKFYPPDTTACIFWLKNRRPADWRDVREVNMSVKRDASELSDAELRDIATGSGKGAADKAGGEEEPPIVH